MISKARARECVSNWLKTQEPGMLHPHSIQVRSYSEHDGGRMVSVVAYMRKRNGRTLCLVLVRLAVTDDGQVLLRQDLRAEATKTLEVSRGSVILEDDPSRLDGPGAKRRFLKAVSHINVPPEWLLAIHTLDSDMFAEIITKAGDIVFVQIEIFRSARERAVHRGKLAPSSAEACVMMVVSSHAEHNFSFIQTRFMSLLTQARDYHEQDQAIAA